MSHDDLSGTPPTTGRRWRDRLAIPIGVAAAAAVVAVGAWSVGAFAQDDPPGPLVAQAEPVLPDLAMGPIEEIAVGTTETGEERLRFAATIVNIGEGALVVRAHRPWVGGEDWSVEQWIEERTGGYSSRLTGATLVFGGDGHDHWHVKQVEVHQIETLDGTVLGRLVKQGFCFFDTNAYELGGSATPDNATYGSGGCATSFDTRVTMGLSVGWGDKYPWHLLDERIDVSDLPNGMYRIRQIADPNQEFEESNESNNDTWVVIELKTVSGGLRDAVAIEAGPSP